MPWQIRDEIWTLRNAEQEDWNRHLLEAGGSKEQYVAHDKDACRICQAHRSHMFTLSQVIRIFGGRLAD